MIRSTRKSIRSVLIGALTLGAGVLLLAGVVLMAFVAIVAAEFLLSDPRS